MALNTVITYMSVQHIIKGAVIVKQAKSRMMIAGPDAVGRKNVPINRKLLYVP